MVEEIGTSAPDQRLHESTAVDQADGQPPPALHPLTILSIRRGKQVVPREHDPHTKPVARLVDLVEESQPRQPLEGDAPPPVVIGQAAASPHGVLAEPPGVLLAQLLALFPQPIQELPLLRLREVVG